MRIFFSFIIICLFTGPLYAQWQAQNSGISNTLRAVYFMTETTGFAVGDALSPNEAPVLKTTDGGNTWVLKSSDTQNPLRDVAFNTNVKGFACGFYGALIKTNDIGETWNEVQFENPMEVNFRAIDFPSKEVGYVAGSGGVFLKTVNIGLSWDSLNTGFPQDLLEIEFLNNDTGYAAGSIGFSNGIILRTYDGGATWQSIYTSSQAIPAFIITKNLNMYAGGGTSPNGGHEFIIQSTDGGDTWQEIYTGPPGKSIRRGAYTTNNLIWFVNDAGEVIKTKDGGENWVVNDLIMPGLSDIFFTEADTGYTVGGLGNILKFTPCPEPLDQLGKIKGDKTVCYGSTTTYSVTPLAGVNSYAWSVPEDAVIDLIENDTLITVTFGLASGQIEVVAGADCDTSIAVAEITVIPPLQAIDSIIGPSDFCAGDTVTYYVTPIENALTYTWSVPADATILQQVDTMLTVAMGNASGIIGVTASDDCDNTSTVMEVTAQFSLAELGNISGDTTVCLLGLGSYSINAVPNADSYDWILPADAQIIYSQADTLVVIQFDSTGGTLTVVANGFCDTASTSFEVTLAGEIIPIDTIFGNTEACQSSLMTYWIEPVAGAISYEWTIPGDATLVSGQGDTIIVVSFGPSSGEIIVQASATDCNTYQASQFVSVSGFLDAPDDIIGVTALCSGDTSQYIVTDVLGADSYHWEVPAGATLLSGQGENLISVLFGTFSGDIVFSAVSSCDTVTSSLYVMVAPPVPPISAIMGDTVVCAGDTVVYNIAAVDGVSYSWIVPANATILSYNGDTSVTVVFGSNSGTIEVVGGSVCTFQDTTLEITVITDLTPNQPITGDATVCSGDTATYTTVATAGFTYSWSVPTDAIILSSQDTSVTVIFGNTSGNISVVANGNCLVMDTSLAVTVISSIPALQPVTGDTLICSGDTATYSAVSVSGFSLAWSVPSDAIVLSSADTSITVLFGIASGNITLTVSNSCFSEELILPVTVVEYPPVPVISFIDNDLVSSAAEGNQWYLDQLPIPGATGQSYTPAVNGVYSVSVTYPPGCTSVSDTFTVLSVGADVAVGHSEVVISPNPFESFTILSLSGNQPLRNSSLVILNVNGNQVAAYENLNGHAVKINRDRLPEGMYFYLLTDERKNLMAAGKLIVQ